jgi:FixJ family two-component response regulator
VVNSTCVAVIDDDEVLCSSLVDLMRSTGYRADPFSSAEGFLASSSLHEVDCVIADVHMPGMSGFDLAIRLRAQGNTKPIILITALLDGSLDEAARSAGAQYLLRKPFQADVLLDCVERSLTDANPSG